MCGAENVLLSADRVGTVEDLHGRGPQPDKARTGRIAARSGDQVCTERLFVSEGHSP